MPHGRASLAVSFALALAGCNGTTPASAPVASPDAASDDTPPVDVPIADLPATDVQTGDVPVTGGPDASGDATAFDAWPPGRLPLLTSQGGPVIAHVQLVTVTYMNDPHQAGDEALGQYLVGSSWLTAVGMDYGVGAGSVLADVRLPVPAPSAQTSDDIEAFLAGRVLDRTLPRAADGSLDQVVYVIYYPRGTRLSEHGAPSCGFHGYHGELTRYGLHAAYAVVPTCDESYRGFSDADSIQTAASHEVIEAVTDPFPHSAPAYEASPDVALRYPNASEVGDRCYGHYLRVDGFLLARSWSNGSARTGGDPCLPLPAPGTAVEAP